MLLPRSSDSRYLSAPFSISPLPSTYRYGLIVTGVTGTLSALSTLVLLIILTYRFLTSSRRGHVTQNQNILLIYNLLLADLQQALSFTISFYWESQNAILAPHPVCSIQGWLIQIGNVSSGFWILAIALHTLLILIKGRRVPHGIFITAIGGIWISALLLTIIGPVKFGNRGFLRAGAWCWIPEDRGAYRLAFHSLWIFLAEFGTILIYTVLFVFLRRRTKRLRLGFNRSFHRTGDMPPATCWENLRVGQEAVHTRNLRKINRAAQYMIVYPTVYVCLTGPLAGGTMVQLAGENKAQLLPDWYWIMAGALVSSCGWLDVIVYSLTRHVFTSTTRHVNVPERVTPSVPSAGDRVGPNNLAQIQVWTGKRGIPIPLVSSIGACLMSEPGNVERRTSTNYASSLESLHHQPKSQATSNQTSVGTMTTDRIVQNSNGKGVMVEGVHSLESE